MPSKPYKVPRAQVRALVEKIGDVWTQEPPGVALVALLVNVNYLLEEILERTPPTVTPQSIRKLHDLVVQVTAKGLEHIIEELS